MRKFQRWIKFVYSYHSCHCKASRYAFVICVHLFLLFRIMFFVIRCAFLCGVKIQWCKQRFEVGHGLSLISIFCCCNIDATVQKPSDFFLIFVIYIWFFVLINSRNTTKIKTWLKIVYWNRRNSVKNKINLFFATHKTIHCAHSNELRR